MRNRLRAVQAHQGDWFAAGLESRRLLSAGMAGLTNIVRDLGTVTGSAAASGVEATASIPSTSSVTFRFQVRDAGEYTLLVRHVGSGLTIQAKTPQGTATVDPGGAGPFQVVPLHLDAATYEITAAAADEPVYVDWELLLTSGVGQAVTGAPSLLPPAATIPLNPTAPASAGPATVTTPSPTSPTTQAVARSLEPAQGESCPVYLVSEPVGRPESPPSARAPGPSLSHPELTPARSDVNSTLLIAMQPALPSEAPDVILPDEPSWFAQVFGGPRLDPATPESTADPSSIEADLARFTAATATATATETDDNDRQHVSLAVISPGLLLGAVAVRVAAQSRIKGNPRLFDRSPASHSPTPGTEPSLQRLLAIFNRSYRPDRCQPVRPLARSS